MSNDLNQCNFIGRLGKDPVTRYTQGGDVVASFSIACGSSWKDKKTGEKQESTEWISVTAFGKLAEICEKYLAKGSRVFISGRMKAEKYTDKNGVEKNSTKIIADRLQMLGDGKGGDTAKADDDERPASKQKTAEPERAVDQFDDDISF